MRVTRLRIFLTFALVAFFLSVSQAQTIFAEDDAGNYGGSWSNTDNEGFGFYPWSFQLNSNSGTFLASSAGDGFGNIDTDGFSFGMYGQGGGNYANAQRSIVHWANGYTFRIDLAVAFRNGNKGIDLIGPDNATFWNFNTGGSPQGYYAGGNNLAWAESVLSVFHLEVVQNGVNVDITLTRGGEIYTTSIANNSLSSFKLYVGETANTGSLNNLYFNNLSVEGFLVPLDNFNRINNNVLGSPSGGQPGAWIETENPATGCVGAEGRFIDIENGRLNLRNSVDGCGLQGNKSAAFDVSTLYPPRFIEANDTMEWHFNMRTNRINLSGFGSTNYGMAFILASSREDFTASDARGYAVVLGENLALDSIKLVSFNNGISNHFPIANLYDLSYITTNFFSIKVTYAPCSNQWTLQVRNDGSVDFANPTTIDNSIQVSSGSNNDHIYSELNFLGAFWNHATASDQRAIFDNIFIPNVSSSTTAYLWTGSVDTDFQVANNWSPARNAPSCNDILEFNTAGNVEVTNIPDQNIGQLIVRTGTNLTLRDLVGVSPSTVSTITISGLDGTDLLVEAGAVLNLDVGNTVNGNGFVLDLQKGSTGRIDGELSFQRTFGTDGRPHQLLAADSAAVEVYGLIAARELLNSSDPFGDTGTQNVVIFKPGSEYIQASGPNPFGFNHPDSKVIFEAGSLFKWTATSGIPSLAGRTYANFTFESNTPQIASGTISSYHIDTLRILQGSFSINFLSGTINGNIEVASGASLVINPSPSGTLLLDGDQTQEIYGAGTFTVGANASLSFNNQSRVRVLKDITVNGAATVQTLGRLEIEGENRILGSGSFTLGNNADLIIGSSQGISASGATGNVQTATRNFSNQSRYTYDGTSDQITGLGLPATLSSNGSLRIDAMGTVSLSHSGTFTTPLLQLENGFFEVGAANTVAISTGGSVSSSNGDFSLGNLGGTVSFNGTGTVSATGDLNFWNVSLAGGGVNFGAGGAPSVHNELVLNAGSFVQDNPPFYEVGSTLVYNSGGDYYLGSEWTLGIVDARGVPYHVQVGRMGVDDSKAFMGVPATPRKCRGNFTIGDLAGGMGYEFGFGENLGGDFHLEGDFIRHENADLITNNRAIFFIGSGDQSITRYGSVNVQEFPYMRINKSGGDVILSNAPATWLKINGAVDITLDLINGNIDLNGQIFEMGGGGDMRVRNNQRTIFSVADAQFNFTEGQKEILSSNSGSLLFNEGVFVNISDGVDFGPSITTINASLQINAGGFANNNAPTYGPEGRLIYNTEGNYSRRVEWNGSGAGAGHPNDVVIINTYLEARGDNSEAVNAPLSVRRDLIIENGGVMDLSAMNLPLEVARDLEIEGSLIADGASGGDVHVGRDWFRWSSGVFTPDSCEVVFNGTDGQNIEAETGVETFYDLSFESAGSKSLLSDIVVENDLHIRNNGNLNPGSQSITLYGNWINDEGETAFNEAGSTVVFEGLALQNIETAGGETFNNLTLDNAGAGVDMIADTRISGSFILTNGILHTGAFETVLLENTTNSGGNISSYVNGTVRKIGFATGVEVPFPVGYYRDFGDSIVDVFQSSSLTPLSSDPTAAFTVSYINENYTPGFTNPNNPPPSEPGLEFASTCNYWIINREAGSVNARVKLTWNDQSCVDIGEPSQLAVARWNGSEWTNQGQTDFSGAPFNQGFVTSNVVSTFSPFTLGSNGNINVLPISLSVFSAQAEGEKVITKWTTSSETNNDYFTVERSADARNFVVVGHIDGAGNSTNTNTYQLNDYNPYFGTSYYRLKQTDFDGSYTYSDIRSVRINEDGEFGIDKVYRTGEGIALEFRSKSAALQVEIYDLLGKRLFFRDLDGNPIQYLDFRPVSGVYLLRLSNGVKVDTEKFFY